MREAKAAQKFTLSWKDRCPAVLEALRKMGIDTSRSCAVEIELDTEWLAYVTVRYYADAEETGALLTVLADAPRVEVKE